VPDCFGHYVFHLHTGWQNHSKMAAAAKRLLSKITPLKETPPSVIKRHFLRMAIYNQWANEVLWEKVSVIPLTEYVMDKKLFFKSIHGTMNRTLPVFHY
jgi:hypothetical protein